jgi:hypothetical protein
VDTQPLRIGENGTWVLPRPSKVRVTRDLSQSPAIENNFISSTTEILTQCLCGFRELVLVKGHQQAAWEE